MSDYIYIKPYLTSIIVRYNLDFADSQEWRIMNFPLEPCACVYLFRESQPWGTSYERQNKDQKSINGYNEYSSW